MQMRRDHLMVHQIDERAQRSDDQSCCDEHGGGRHSLLVPLGNTAAAGSPGEGTAAGDRILGHRSHDGGGGDRVGGRQDHYWVPAQLGGGVG